MIPLGSWFAALLWATQLQRFAVARATPVDWGWADLRHPDLFGTTGRIRLDAGRYVDIATRGYRTSEGDEAVFPLFPLLIRWAAPYLGGEAAAAVRLSLGASLASVLLWWRWLRVQGIGGAGRFVGLALLLAYPYAFLLFGVAYSDSVLLALVLGSVLLVESRHLVLAGIVAAAATAARPNAVVLPFALAVLGAERDGIRVLGRGWRRAIRSLRPVHAAPLLGLAGIGGYAWWNADRTGDPFYFSAIQHSYGHRSLADVYTWLKTNLVTNGNVFRTGLDPLHEAISFGVLVTAALALPTLVKRFGWGYAVFTAGLIVLTWGAAVAFAPAGRYLLPCAPFVLACLIPWLLRRRRRLVLLLGVFLIWQTVLAYGLSGPFPPIINQAAW